MRAYVAKRKDMLHCHYGCCGYKAWRGGRSRGDYPAKAARHAARQASKSVVDQELFLYQYDVNLVTRDLEKETLDIVDDLLREIHDEDDYYNRIFNEDHRSTLDDDAEYDFESYGSDYIC